MTLTPLKPTMHQLPTPPCGPEQNHFAFFRDEDWVIHFWRSCGLFLPSLLGCDALAGLRTAPIIPWCYAPALQALAASKGDGRRCTGNRTSQWERK